MHYQGTICRLLWNGKSHGTGFTFSDDRAHVITAYHVIEEPYRSSLAGTRLSPGRAGLIADFSKIDEQRQIIDIIAPSGLAREQDWAILKLDAPTSEQPLKLAVPENDTICTVWGYPQTLDVGLQKPENVVLKGTLNDVVPYHKSPFFKVIATNADDDCRGISGAPVIADDAYVGLILSTYTNERGAPAFHQLKACRLDGIDEACSRLGIAVVKATAASVMPDDAWLRIALKVNANLEMLLPRGIEDALSASFAEISKLEVILRNAMKRLLEIDKNTYTKTIGLQHCTISGAWIAWDSALHVSAMKSPATLLSILFEARDRAPQTPLLDLAIERLQSEILQRAKAS